MKLNCVSVNQNWALGPPVKRRRIQCDYRPLLQNATCTAVHSCILQPTICLHSMKEIYGSTILLSIRTCSVVESKVSRKVWRRRRNNIARSTRSFCSWAVIFLLGYPEKAQFQRLGQVSFAEKVRVLRQEGGPGYCAVLHISWGDRRAHLHCDDARSGVGGKQQAYGAQHQHLRWRLKKLQLAKIQGHTTM